MHKNADVFLHSYIYLPFPIAGGIAAVAFHEFVYKRVAELVEEEEANDILEGHRDDEDGY